MEEKKVIETMEDVIKAIKDKNVIETIKDIIKTMKDKDVIKTMKDVYVKKDANIVYYIGSFKDDDGTVKIDGNAELTRIEESAFAHSGVEKILFTGCLQNIDENTPEDCGKLNAVILGEKAFEGCRELNAVIFGELGEAGAEGLKNLKLSDIKCNFIIQAGAFKDCSKLETLVLPRVPDDDHEHTLVIEKDAFFGCESLRTVVAICGKIAFTGNPFDGCPDYLTFVCKENSEVERFARENGYRSVCV